MKHAMIVMGLVPMLLVGCMAIPYSVSNVSASAPYASAFLSAYNSTQGLGALSNSVLHSTYWCNATPPIDTAISPGATILGDEFETELWKYSDSTARIVTRDFNNPTYPIEFGADAIVGPPSAGLHAPLNATILSVYILARFIGPYPSSPTNAAYVTYSTAATPTWGGSFTLASGNLGVTNFWLSPTSFSWDYLQDWVPVPTLAADITGEESWTPAMLRSSDLRVLLYMTLPAATTYYLDYIGIFYYWSYGAGGLDSPPTDEGSGHFGIPSAIGLFGIIGFAGMIATPVAAIWLSRRSDQPRLIFGIQMMIAFVVCLGLFLAAIL